MLRFLFDPLGDWHNDLVLIIDGLPGIARIVDSYYLSGLLDDFEEDEVGDVRREVVLRYVQFVLEQIMEVDGQERFIPMDLSDQYVGGLLLNQARNGLLNVKYVWSNVLSGSSLQMDQDFSLIDWTEVGEWLLSRESVIEGLNWTLRNINRSHE
jgi:glucose uptake protein GlcU